MPGQGIGYVFGHSSLPVQGLREGVQPLDLPIEPPLILAPATRRAEGSALALGSDLLSSPSGIAPGLACYAVAG